MRAHVRTDRPARGERDRFLAHLPASGRVEEEGLAMADALQILTDRPSPQRAEEALDLFARALGMLTEGVFLIDLSRPEHPLIFANPAFARLTGYAPEEMIGRDYGLFRGPDSDPAVFAEVRAALHDRRAWSGELRVRRKDGTAASHALRLVPALDTAGQARYGLGVQSDVSEPKDLQERLHQAEKMAALGLLAGGIAHDFNNMLTAILGYCDILLAGAPSGQPREGLEKIREAGERAASLSRQLLALSRKQLPQPRLVDVRAILAGMDSLLRRLTGEAIELVTVTDPALGPVEAVPGQMEQILLNLVVNARDALPEGGRITIELANALPEAGRARGPGVLRPGPYVMLAVTDTGCGMGEEILAELFRPLFTTKGAGQGTGLGLFTVHEIVKQNGGLIAVASQPGQGTRVEIYLPQRAPVGQ
jgi:PAS domain S-box-containing protein